MEKIIIDESQFVRTISRISHEIIEKHQTVMICEINHRNEPEELVFIRITPNQQKSIKKSGRMLIADYPYIPTAKQLKLDFGQHLN